MANARKLADTAKSRLSTERRGTAATILVRIAGSLSRSTEAATQPELVDAEVHENSDGRRVSSRSWGTAPDLGMSLKLVNTVGSSDSAGQEHA